MPIDDRTTNRNYQLPNAGNQLSDDVARLRAALQAIDADVFARYTKTEVDTLINNLINGAPGALDTLNELAAAMGDDPNFAATVTNSIAAINTELANRYTKAESDARYVQGAVQTEMVFTAGLNQTAYTLTTGVINKASALVTVDGVVQPTSEYSLSMDGLTLTLSEAPAQGAKVRVLALGVASAGAPADDTVTTAKLRDGAVTSAKLAQPFTLATAVVASGSNSVFDFTSIPSWVKRITVMCYQVSTTISGNLYVRIGSGSFQATGYSSTYWYASTGSGISSDAFVLSATNSGYYHDLTFTLTLVGSNKWMLSGIANLLIATNVGVQTIGSVALSGTLDRLRFATSAGVFDFGTVNILYEG